MQPGTLHCSKYIKFHCMGFVIQQYSQYTHYIIEMVQASEKGSSALTTGIVIGASPLCLVLASPFVGYFVSFKTFSELSILTRTFTAASKVGSEVHIDIWDSTGRWRFLSTRVRPKLPLTDTYCSVCYFFADFWPTCLQVQCLLCLV